MIQGRHKTRFIYEHLLMILLIEEIGVNLLDHDEPLKIDRTVLDTQEYVAHSPRADFGQNPIALRDRTIRRRGDGRRILL